MMAIDLKALMKDNSKQGNLMELEDGKGKEGKFKDSGWKVNLINKLKNMIRRESVDMK